jgi:hypothetical protein
VAFVAVTAKVDEPPGAIEVGLALMPVVGAASVVGAVANWPPPHPPSSMSSKEQRITEKGILLKDWRTVGAVKVSSLPSPKGACLPVELLTQSSYNQAVTCHQYSSRFITSAE